MVMIEQENVISVKLRTPQFIRQENYHHFSEIYYLYMFQMKIQIFEYPNP